MMNKSAIDWCDFSWNPVTGCNFGCEYCYARRQATRFSGNTRLNMTNEQLKTETAGLYVLEQPFKNYNGAVLPFPAGFAPTFHKYRLGDPAKKKKPANIFVCSMADLFGNWIPEEWIVRILGTGNPIGVIIATVVGVPMYADIFGTIPVAEALLAKGAQLGTILSFMMGVTTLSLPSMIMLRKAVKPKLLGIFIVICAVGIIIVGYFFNAIQYLLV